MSQTIEFHFSNPEESPGYLLWQVTMLWQRKMKRALDKVDLTHTQFVLLAALAWLARNNEPVTQVDIANHSNTDRMMVSKVLRTLQDKGLIGRQEHETDTRAKTVSLTNSGWIALQQAIKIVEQVDKGFFSGPQTQTEYFNQGMIRLLKQNGE